MRGEAIPSSGSPEVVPSLPAEGGEEHREQERGRVYEVSADGEPMERELEEEWSQREKQEPLESPGVAPHPRQTQNHGYGKETEVVAAQLNGKPCTLRGAQ